MQCLQFRIILELKLHEADTQVNEQKIIWSYLFKKKKKSTDSPIHL